MHVARRAYAKRSVVRATDVVRGNAWFSERVGAAMAKICS
jgi:hypothetical protein